MPRFTEEQIEILLRARTGEITSNDKMYYDISFDRYVHINADNKLHFLKTEAAKRVAYELTGRVVKGNYIIEELPNVRSVFNPKRERGLYRDGADVFFNFFEEPAAFALKAEKKHKSNDISFVENYKYYSILLSNLFTKPENLEYFVNWLSVIVNERMKTRTAIILKGVEGTGKGVLWEELIVPIFSEKYTVTMENESLRSQFNGQMENKLFVLFNEIKGDFRESATLYEKLKIYITDSKISINNKYGMSGEADNFFNCLFFSNSDLPVQISPTDRRYTVFNTSTTPLLEICENMGITTDDFIEGLRKERNAFIADLFAYNYSISAACKTMNTEEKTLIAEATTPKITLVSKKLLAQDFDWLYERGIDTLETMKSDIKNETAETVINKLQADFEELLEKRLTQGFLTTKDLVVLYRLFVNFDETNVSKVTSAWGASLGKSKQKKINGQKLRVREFGVKKDWTIPKEEEEDDIPETNYIPEVNTFSLENLEKRAEEFAEKAIAAAALDDEDDDIPY